MPYETQLLSPSRTADAAPTLAYSAMPEVGFKIAEFLRELGYNSFNAGNDTAESVAYAILAGLGEQGRSGLLITPEYGARVRIAKVFTDMEITPDKPIDFGASKFCEYCKKCALSCPAQAISYTDEMTWGEEMRPDEEGVYIASNHFGIKNIIQMN